MDVEIIFMDAAVPKKIQCDNVYTKGHMLCIRQGEYIYKYPLDHIFSVCHKHGCHIGSREHQKKHGLIPKKGRPFQEGVEHEQTPKPV